MARALEAETREALQQEADQAIYERRNFAVEQERRIKESELNTEIAVEEKQKQIAEKKMETERTKQENQAQLRMMQVEADIDTERKRKELVDLAAENEKSQADVRKYTLEAVLGAYKEMDWKTLMAIQGEGMDPRNHIALAFRELASQAGKIDHLSITPDLLESLIDRKSTSPRKPRRQGRDRQ